MDSVIGGEAENSTQQADVPCRKYVSTPENKDEV